VISDQTIPSLLVALALLGIASLVVVLATTVHL